MNELFYKLFDQKLKRAFENPAIYQERNIKTKYGILSYEICAEVIPEEVLLGKNPSQIIKYKTESRELQEKFIQYITEAEMLIDSSPREEKFMKELDKLVRLKIKPEVQRISTQKLSLWEQLFNESLKQTVSKPVLASALTLLIMPDASYLDLLSYSTAAWNSGMANKLLDLRLKEKQINKNALFFLHDFKS